jgi:hypothetical protein
MRSKPEIDSVSQISAGERRTGDFGKPIEPFVLATEPAAQLFRPVTVTGP